MIGAATLAYIAGVMDSDGTIGVRRSTYGIRVRGDSKQPIYSERVCLKQVEPQAIDLIYSLFKGSRYLSSPSASKGRRLHTWHATDLKASEFLASILPWLLIKKPQALNCLQLRSLKEESKQARVAKGRGHVGAGRRTLSHSIAMEKCYIHAHELNRVGI